MKYPELKKELKALAKEIKVLKHKRDNWRQYKNDLRYDLHNQAQSVFMSRCAAKSWQFRHKHIAYCLLRGRKYEEIENYCRVEPNWQIIEQIKLKYEETKFRTV